ncbi:MAG: EAL domain-containing protein [Usitatibacter sp.]
MNVLPVATVPRILVIDDNVAIHQDFRKVFGAHRTHAARTAAEIALFGAGSVESAPDFRVDSALQGQEGLALVLQALAQSSPYAVAFIDVRMPPGWDGIETTARIWQADPDVQVVICTAYSDYSWSETLARLGRSDRLVILKKPFDNIEVIQLASALSEKWHLARAARSTLVDLEERVEARTRELAKALDRMNRLNRVYAVLSGINSLIVRVRDRDELFNEACRIAVDAGGFPMSMIALIGSDAADVVLLASAGKDAELVARIKAILSSRDRGPGTMIARALREKTPTISNECRGDPKMVFGERYADAGVRSIAVLPLIVGGEAKGVLTLYSDEPGFFDVEEIALLAELAGDIAFAIDHIEKQELLDYLAYYDTLTGLANRTLFLERVGQSLRGAQSPGHKLAVFLIDIERFKSINDSLGRPVGDALLKQVAQWLTRVAGEASLVARLDADHFAAVLPQVSAQGSVERLLEKWMGKFVGHPFRVDDAVFRLAAKVGVAIYPDDGVDAETLFRSAEAGLKKAKASGERYLFHTQGMTERAAGRLTLESQLRRAVDRGEFVLHYQPKVSIASGKLTGAEGLIRWNDPITGLVPPGRFVPMLEETGLIHEVGRWAMRQALADYLRCETAGLPAARMAVNVSPMQLRHRGFVDEIRELVATDPRAAAGLELEITESLIMEDVPHTIASLAAIRALGVKVAIDDFGTGFSSLSYLARLPVDTLKIDRSFVVDMTSGSQGLALVSTIIGLAHSLKLKVVAEGVETEEQSGLLGLLGCDEMQGFLLSKAVPTAEYEGRFLVRQTAKAQPVAVRAS